MPAKKKTKRSLNSSAPSAKRRKIGRWRQLIATSSRALRAKNISPAKKIELLEKRAEAYRQLGRVLESAADSEQLAALRRLQIEEQAEEIRQARAELEILSSIAQALVDQADYQRIGQIVGEHIQKSFDAEITGIGLYDKAAGIISVPYYYEHGVLKDVPSYEYGRGVTSYVLKTRKPLYIANAKQAEKYGVIYSKELPSETMLFAPIISGKEALGVLSIQHSQQHAYGKHELELLTAIANSMAVAIENARLFNETAQRNAELAVITSVQAGLADELDIQAIYDKVGDKLREIFKVGAITINVFDLEANTNSYVYGFEGGERSPNLTIPVSDIWYLFLGQEGNIFLRNTGAEEVYKRFDHKAPYGKLPKSILAIKLPQKGKQITAISLMDIERENTFTQADARLLQTLANSMAVALENARLFNEIQKSHHEISDALAQQTATSDILRTLANSPADINPVLQAVAQHAANLCEANDVQIYKVDGEQLRQLAHFGPLPALEDGEGLPLVPGLVTGRAVLERRTIHLEDARNLSKEDYPESVKLQRRLGHRTAIATPLIREAEAIGAIVVRRNEVRPFTENQISLLNTFADQAAIAIENVRLFDQLQTRNREVTEALELQTANAEILEVISSSPEDLENILSKIVEKAALLSKSDDAAIGFVDGDLLTARAHYGSIPFFKTGEGIRFNRESVAGRAIIDGKPVQALHNPKDKKSEFPLGDKVAKKFGYAMTFATPLVIQGTTSGAIVIRRVEPSLLTEKEISLLQNFANQAVIAIDKARLLSETKRLLDETTQRNAELAVINSVQEGLSRSLKLQEIIDLVGEKVGEIFHADTVFAGLYDAARDWGSHIYYVDGGKRVPVADGPVIRPSLAAHVADTKKPLLLGTKEEGAKLGAIRVVRRKGEEDRNESVVGVPIMKGKSVIGGISVQSYKRNAYTKDDLRLLETLASSMSVALQNAQLFDETSQRNAELAVINSVQEGLSHSLKFQEIVDLVGEKVGEIFHADTVSVGLYDEERDWGTHIYYVDRGRRVALPDAPLPRPSLTAHVVDTKKPLHLGTKEESAEFGAIRLSPSEGEEDQNESNLYVPIMAGKKVMGAISVQSYKRNAYTKDDLRLLQTLAGSMSVALQNAQLFDETSQRNAELAVINSVQEAMSKQLDIKGIYEAVGEEIKDIFQAQAVILGAFDLISGMNYPHYFYEKGERFYPDPVPFSGLLKELISTRKTIVINTGFMAKVEEYGMTTLAGSETSKSGVFVPLVTGDKVIGAISLQNIDRENAFSDSDVRLLETLANGMSVALENARLFDETSQRNAELAIINSVQEGIASKLDVHAIYELVGEKLGQVFPNADVTVGRYDPETDMAIGEYLVEHGKRLPVGSFKVDGVGFIGELVRNPHTQVINENMEQALKEHGSRVIEGTSMAKSFVNVPLVIDGVLQGALQLQNMYKEHAFSESDVRLLETIANSVSIALENARLFDETAQRNAELAVINSVQASLAEHMDIQGIYETVGQKLCEIFNTGVGIINYDLDAKTRTYVFSFVDGKRDAVVTEPMNDLHEFFLSQKSGFLHNNFHSFVEQFKSSPPFKVWPKSVIWVPLPKTGNQITAINLVDNERENVFSESDLRLLETLASSMSVALESARLFDETTQRNAELSIINAVQEGLASKLEIGSIIDLVGGKLGEIFPDMDVVQINLYDRENDLIHIPYCVEKGLRHEHESRKPWSIRKLVIESRQAVVNNGPQDDGRLREMAEKFGVGEMVNPLIAGEMPKSVLFVPLLVGDQVRGIISLQNMARENAFPDSTVQLLSTLANSMSVALENARLFDETERLLEESRKKEEELSTVNTVGQAVASELELASLIELIGVQVRKIFKADIAYVALYNEENELIEFPYLFGDTLPPLKMGEGVVSQVIQGGKPVLINRDEAWKETEQKLTRIGARALSYLGVPILAGKHAIGAISVQSIQKSGRFDEADQHLLSTIAANVGAAIENARLFAEVARQKEYFETFFQYSPAAVVVVDFNGKVISWNPAAQHLFGYTAEEAIGRDVDALVAADPRVEAEARMYTKKFTGELGRVEVKGQRTRKDGSLVDVEVKGLPIAVEGKMVGLLVIYHDISEIESARRAAEEANQAKSAFLANMSHELRTPLNAIIGFTRIVRRKGGEALPDKQLENLDKVLVSAEHLLGLINTILDIAKIEAGRMELQLGDSNLAALVDGCLATTQPLVTPGVQLLSSLPPDLPQMHSDEEKIRQVLLNLLSNAAKFTRTGSIRVNGEMKDGKISLAVQDTGIGIAPEDLGKIFEEFQQADSTTTREYGGTGLGLSISRSLAKLLGGDLTVASVEGQGSTFTLTVPMHLGPVSAIVDGKEEVAAALDPDKPIVLVIDDQPDMFHILQQNLGEAGYQVVGALSGEEGIEKARGLHPFAITLDIMMPRKDGWQVLYELKNDPATKEIPVIILTIVDNKPMGFRLGASDYLVKPLSERAVLDALERLAKSNGGVRARKLLVVDDDPKVVDLVQQMLDGEGFAIETAADGVEALSHIGGSRPDAILLDLLMPRMDGFQFIDELRERPQSRSIPIIVLTAKSLSNEEQTLLEKSVAAIVKKQGLGSDALIQKIRQIVPAPRSA